MDAVVHPAGVEVLVVLADGSVSLRTRREGKMGATGARRSVCAVGGGREASLSATGGHPPTHHPQLPTGLLLLLMRFLNKSRMCPARNMQIQLRSRGGAGRDASGLARRGRVGRRTPDGPAPHQK